MIRKIYLSCVVFVCFVLFAEAVNIKVTATTKKIALRHNVKQNGESGMEVLCSFTVKGMKNMKGACNIYFQTLAGQPLRDVNQRYCTTNGQIATHKTFTPADDVSDYNDFAIFIPYSELHIDEENKDLRVYYTLSCEGKQVVASEYVYLKWTGGHTSAWATRNATESATDARVEKLVQHIDHNTMENGQKGMLVNCTFDAYNLRNLNIEIVLQVNITYKHILKYTRVLTCSSDQDHIADCKLFVPYADILQYREEYYKGHKKGSQFIITSQFDILHGERKLNNSIQHRNLQYITVN